MAASLKEVDTQERASAEQQARVGDKGMDGKQQQALRLKVGQAFALSAKWCAIVVIRCRQSCHLALGVRFMPMVCVDVTVGRPRTCGHCWFVYKFRTPFIRDFYSLSQSYVAG